MIAAAVALCVFTTFIFCTALALPANTTHALYALSFLVTFFFIFSFTLSKLQPSNVGTWFYLFSMTLAGYGVYLFFAAIPLAIILAVFSFSGNALPAIIPKLFFIFGLLTGTIGHIQSWFIGVRKHKVTITNMPASWRGKHIVLISDTHFGHVRQDRFAKRIVNKILKLQPAFVIHAGDFYDGPSIPLQKIITVWQELTKKIPMFYSPGNHEQYGDYKTFLDSIRTIGATVLENEKIIHEGLQIAGITYHAKGDAELAAQSIKKLLLDPALPTIFINHPPTFHESILAAGADLMVSGHTHNGQFWPGTYIAQYIYKQFTYGKKMYGDMVTITSRGVGTAGPPIRFLNAPELVVISFN